MPYLWLIPNNFPESMIGEYQKERSPNRFEFRKGEAIALDIGIPHFKFHVRLEELNRMGCLCNNTPVPLLTPEVSELVKRMCENDVQLIESIVEAKDGISASYKLLNVVRKVKGIDHDKSKYFMIPGTEQIMGFEYLMYRPDCLGDANIARDEEYKGHLLVSENLFEQLQKLDYMGVGLYKSEQLHW